MTLDVYKKKLNNINFIICIRFLLIYFIKKKPANLNPEHKSNNLYDESTDAYSRKVNRNSS